MLKRGVIATLLALAVLADGATAHAAIRHRVNQVVRLATLKQSTDYPAAGSTAVYAGRIRSRLGRGAIVETITITGHPSPAVFTLEGTSTAFYAQGTTRSAFTGTGTVQPGDTFILAGHGRYTGGTLDRRVRRRYSFTGGAPTPPMPAPTAPTPCAVPAGWKVVASDAQVVVILSQPDYPIQEYRYCNYAHASRGYQLLVRNDDSGYLGGQATCSTVDGVARSYLLYHSTTALDSPACNGFGSPAMSSTIYAVDTASGTSRSFPQEDPNAGSGFDGGQITSALIAPPGVAAWIFTDVPCTATGPGAKYEALKAYSFRTDAVTTLDTGDPNEMYNSPPSLGNLALYPCGEGCSPNTVTVAWTHDGAQRYAQVN